MNTMQRADSLTAISLGAGVLVPLLYFGIQFVAAPFHPGYSFLTQAASDLGSDRSSLPAAFNVGAVLTGVAALVAAVGVRAVLARLRVHLVPMVLTTLTLVAVGLGNIWAGVFPLPDPRHGANPFTPGFFLMPLILTVAVWSLPDAGTLRVYLVLNLALLVGLIAVRAFNLDVRSIEGLFQRTLALVAFAPVGVVAWFLMGKTAWGGAKPSPGRSS